MESPQPDSDKPKIIIDEDWKSRVEREREQLKEQPKEQPKAEPSSRPSKDAPRLPPASFEFLVSSIFTQALVAMGQIPNPTDGKATIELDLARHHIDMLGMLQEKTSGNLTTQESKMIEEVLHTLRMAYVQVQSRPDHK